MENNISFKADLVEALEQKFTSEYTVFGVYFGEGDVEAGGQHWNFSRSSEDGEICVVKEIQEITFYGQIRNFQISRQGIECEFEDEVALKFQISSLKILFDLNEEKWEQLSKMAVTIFAGKDYFKIV